MTYEKADHLEKKQIDDQGAVYTPREIALEMAKLLNLKKRELVLEPCVGKGNLLVALLETYPFLKNEDLYGIDIDPEAIKFCMEKFPGGHFQVGDVLKDPFTDDDFWEKPPLMLWDEYKLIKPIKIFGKKLEEEKIKKLRLKNKKLDLKVKQKKIKQKRVNITK